MTQRYVLPALTAVRHDESSQLVTAQEKTQSDVKGQENPSLASGDRLHVPGVEASGDRSHTPMSQARRIQVRHRV